MIQKEPSTVLAFNKFVSLMKDVMREFDIQFITVYNIENKLEEHYPQYMAFIEEQLNGKFKIMQKRFQSEEI